MKMILLLLLAAGVWLPLSGKAQSDDSMVTYNNFRITPYLSNQNMQLAAGYRTNSALASYTGEYSWSHLYLNEGKVMVMGQIRPKEAKLIQLNKTGEADWELPIEGVCYKLGKLGKNALLIHGEKVGLGNYKDLTLLASLIDPSTGKIVKTVPVYQQAEDYVSEPKFFMDPEGKWFYVGSRKTKITPRLHLDSKKTNALYNNTLSFSIKAFKENLEAGDEMELPIPPEGDAFIGCEMSDKGYLYIAYFSEKGRLFAERRSRTDNFKKVVELATNFTPMKKKTGITPFFYTPFSGAERIFIHFQYVNDDKKPVADFFTLDFEKNKVFKSSEINDKEFGISLRDTYSEVGGVDLGKPQIVAAFSDVSQIIEAGNKRIVLREDIRLNEIVNRDMSRTSGSVSRQRFYQSYSLIIEVFNENNKLVKRWLIPKNYIPESLTGLQSAGYVIKDQLIVFNNATKKGKPFGVVSTFDLKTLKPISRRFIDKVNNNRWMAIEPGAICWFSDSYLLPYSVSKSTNAGLKGSFNTVLETKDIKF